MKLFILCAAASLYVVYCKPLQSDYSSSGNDGFLDLLSNRRLCKDDVYVIRFSETILTIFTKCMVSGVPVCDDENTDKEGPTICLAPAESLSDVPQFEALGVFTKDEGRHIQFYYKISERLASQISRSDRLRGICGDIEKMRPGAHEACLLEKY